MKTISIIILCYIFIGNFCVAWSKSRDVQLSPDENIFQAYCMRHKKSCIYMKIHFFSKDKMASTTYSYYPIKSAETIQTFNAMARVYSTDKDTKGIVTKHVDIYDASNKVWIEAKGSPNCGYCIVLDKTTHGKTMDWIRVIRTRTSNKLNNPNTYLVTDISVNHWEQELIKVSVVMPKGVNIYADARTNSVHLPSVPRSVNGSIELFMNNDWVKSEQPDYITISPMKSWKEVAASYMGRQKNILAMPNHFTRYYGANSASVIEKIVKNISSMTWNSRPGLASIFPHREVDSILRSHTADCKDYATVLQAALLKAGIVSHPILFNKMGLPPLSFSVPSRWPNHVIVYVPSIDKFIDMTIVIGSKGKYGWRTSADFYKGDIGLDMTSGRFVVIH